MKKKKIVAMAVAVAVFAGNVFGDGSCYKTVSANNSVKKQESVTEDCIKSDEKTEFLNLYDSKLFSKNNDNVVLSEDEKTQGLMISGKTEEIEKTDFTIDRQVDFSKNSRYIVFSAIAERKREISISFFLDDSAESFAKINLSRQNRKNVWTNNDNKCVRLDTEKISGKHKISFRFTDNDGKKYKGEDLKILLNYLFFLEEDIPTVSLDIGESKTPIESMNGDLSHQTECYGNMTLNIPKGYKSEYTDKELKTGTYELDYIRGRGNSTWGPDKKPYKLKLEKKADLLGMGSNKHWILLANYYDITMLRNKFTYWLGNAIGLEFTPKCEFVNVVMNGKYLGSYYLCEQVRVGKNRVDIDDLSADSESKAVTSGSAITGGYLLACEQESDRLNINTEKGMTFAIESPDFEDYTNVEQYNYISNYVQQTENAIFGKGFKDSNGVSYEDYLDVDSAIDYYWIQEFSLNGDAFGSGSTYLYKKRNGKLYWGPLWDFDYVAWGATEYNYGNSVTGLNLERTPWFTKLFTNDKFRKKFAARWPYIKEKLLEGIKDGGIIDKYSNRQYSSQRSNYYVNKMYSDEYIFEGNYALNELIDDAKVNDILGTSSDISKNVTYDSEETRFKQWIKERIDWIDKNISSIDTLVSGTTLTFKVDGKVYDVVEYVKSVDTKMPKDPTKKGYYFDGWYYKQKIDGKTYELKFSDCVSFDDKKVTVYAKWKKKTKANKPKKLVFQCEDVYMSPYDDYNLKYSVQPYGAVTSDIKWSTSDKEVATVENGFVHTAEKQGICTITAKVKGLKAVKCKVHVVSLEDMTILKDFKLSKTNMTLKKGKTQKLNVKLLPLKVYNPNICFDSSNKKVVAVDEAGVVHAKKKGTAVIAVYSTQLEKVKFCKVKVK